MTSRRSGNPPSPRVGPPDAGDTSADPSSNAIARRVWTPNARREPTRQRMSTDHHAQRSRSGTMAADRCPILSAFPNPASDRHRTPARAVNCTLGPVTRSDEHRLRGQVWRIDMPPSTGMIAPLTKLAAGRHRLSVMWATSSGRP